MVRKFNLRVEVCYRDYFVELFFLFSYLYLQLQWRQKSRRVPKFKWRRKSAQWRR